MTDNDINKIIDKIDSLHRKILNSKFAEQVTESEMMSLILVVQELTRQKAEIERLNEVVERLQKHNRALCMLEKMQIDRIKSEARKEFAEGLRSIYLNDKRYDRPNPHTLLIKLFNNIDKLLEEMEKET